MSNLAYNINNVEYKLDITYLCYIEDMVEEIRYSGDYTSEEASDMIGSVILDTTKFELPCTSIVEFEPKNIGYLLDNLTKRIQNVSSFAGVSMYDIFLNVVKHMKEYEREDPVIFRAIVQGLESNIKYIIKENNQSNE